MKHDSEDANLEQGWQLSDAVALTRQHPGGYVLVELDTLRTHELLDRAGDLLEIGGKTLAGNDNEERAFLEHAAEAGWIVSESGEREH